MAITELKLTPEQFAEIVAREKPYLIEIEEQVQKLENGHGTIELRLEVRQKTVVKVSFYSSATWVHPRGDGKPDPLTR